VDNVDVFSDCGVMDEYHITFKESQTNKVNSFGWGTGHRK